MRLRAVAASAGLVIVVMAIVQSVGVHAGLTSSVHWVVTSSLSNATMEWIDVAATTFSISNTSLEWMPTAYAAYGFDGDPSLAAFTSPPPSSPAEAPPPPSAPPPPRASPPSPAPAPRAARHDTGLGCLVTKWNQVWRIDSAGVRAWIRIPTAECRQRALDFGQVGDVACLRLPAWLKCGLQEMCPPG